MRRYAAVLVAALLVVAAPAPAQVRAQRDTVGFAVSGADMQAVLSAARAAEGLPAPGADAVPPAVAVILPHDDYLYAGRTAVHALPYLQAKRWIVFGVCHACRRVGVFDRLLLDDSAAWRVAGRDWPVDTQLRDDLASRLGDLVEVSAERQAAEHSVEALLPWLGSAVDDPQFVPVLVAGMDLEPLQQRAAAFAAVLADLCRERGWVPGRDLGILISADAVHYGCEGWGGSGYAPFGCDAAGHAAGVAQDATLAAATLAGPLGDAGIAAFARLVWNEGGPGWPAEPYRITWCGMWSIPFGLTVAARLQEDLGAPPLEGALLRYGDSVGDGRLEVRTDHLGVTAPNTLAHWVGYATVVYMPQR
ncbi:MAG TPA: AmmeMemoRadiSam system protein B [Candidatus Krumholzibacteria bacterium]|nr:AmmeMemoRadiSam system protein B [Candidatus Krumholzibacteria bacterium]